MTPPIDPNLHTSDFSYELPEDLIAQTPPEPRDSSRLLVLDRATGTIAHSRISQLVRYLRSDDVVVANNSRVIAARIPVRREITGGKGEILLLRRDDCGIWEALARPARRIHPGNTLIVASHPGSGLRDAKITVVSRESDGIVQVRLDPLLEKHLSDYGDTPLPPYITQPLMDQTRYQTVYSSIPGSAAAPTAGLHFSQELIAELKEFGIEWVEITLHIGLDTFRPVSVERVADHKIHSEWCTVSEEAARTVRSARASGRRVIALGTTAARTLETAGRLWKEGTTGGFSTETSIFITPGHQWMVVDAMVTNFHLPRSTLLMMVSSFAGCERILGAYQVAVEERYRFYSFGDAMLIV